MMVDPNTGAPMDPAMMGGAPPGMPPGPPPPPGGGALPPEVEQTISQLITGVDELAALVQSFQKTQDELVQKVQQMSQQMMQMQMQVQQTEKMLSQPAGFEG
jgi:hypothetical protein